MDARPRPTGTVAFLFTDVEGSTAAWEAEPEAMAAALTRLEVLVNGAATTGHRAVEQGAGDSAVMAFERASDAAAAAVALQRSISAEPWTTAGSLRVRMALHLGEVGIGPDGTYRGLTMNRCGRLLATAHGGQVVASGAFVAVIRESDDGVADLSWTDLGTHHLRGIEAPVRIWQACHPDLAREHPPLRTPEGRGLRLPGTTSALVGRDREVDQLHEMLDEHRTVVIVGSGGSGKTRLAVELAQRALEDFDDVAWVDLAKLGERDHIDAVVVSELALRDGAGNLRRRIVEHLRATRTLLVLDNCEHVLAAAAALTTELVAQCPALHVLATSREPLEAPGEVLLRLGPLDVPADGAALFASAAGTLFADRVARARAGRPLTDDDADAAAEICRRLDGIPLALELAAARTRSLPLPVVASRLEERFALLVGGPRSALARQRTLEASVAWSYDMLDAGEQAALRHLAVCSGPFDLVAADAVVAVDDANAVDLVAALVDKSLLLDESIGGDGRYRILETVRFYARDRSVQAGDGAMSRDRHLAWILAETAGLPDVFESSAAADAVLRVDSIIDEARAAMEWALSSDRPDDVARITASLAWWWVWRGLGGEALAWFDRAAAAGGRSDDHRLAAAVGFARHLAVAHRQPSHTEIEREAGAAIAASVAAGDCGTEAHSRLLLEVHRSFHDPIGRRPALEAAAALCRETGSPYWSTLGDVLVAQSRMFQQQLLEADPLVREAEPAAAAAGNHQLIVETMARRCAIAEGLGDYDVAVAAMEALDRAIDGVATRDIRAMALRSVSVIELARGDIDGVLARLQVEIDRYLRDEDLQFVPLLTDPLGYALSLAGRAEDAVAMLEPVWNRPEIRTSRVYSVIIAPPYATALWATGDRAAARKVLAQTTYDAQVTDSDVVAAWTGLVDGSFDLDEGDAASAEPKLHNALRVLWANRRRQHTCDGLEAVARLDLEFGRAAAAAVLLGAASRERDEQRVVLRPGSQAAYDTSIEQARADLGTDVFEERWTRGRGLSLDEAVEYAERGRGERTRPTQGWDALTGTEKRVAALAADGLTNRQIAERLVVGTETVKTHMAAILRKLTLTNRTQLARAIGERAQVAER